MKAFVIIPEMTGDHEAVIPIIAVSMTPEPLYHGLSRVFIAAAIRARRAAEAIGINCEVTLRPTIVRNYPPNGIFPRGHDGFWSILL
jgi:hypothetical protein